MSTPTLLEYSSSPSPSHSPRVFDLQLPFGQDRSHLASRAAAVSSTANASKAAARLMHGGRSPRRPSTPPEAEPLRTAPSSDMYSPPVGGETLHSTQQATAAATDSPATAAASSLSHLGLPSHTGARRLTPAPPLSALLADVTSSTSPLLNYNRSAVKSERVDDFLSSGAPPLRAVDNITDPARTLRQEAEMLSALSTAIHEDDAQQRAVQEQLHGSDHAVAVDDLPLGPQRRMPALPAGQLKSLVRSHVRHVGLSSRLKTRVHIRELRDAQTERREQQLQASRALYLDQRPVPPGSTVGSTPAAPHPRKRPPRLPSYTARNYKPSAHENAAALFEKLGLEDLQASLQSQFAQKGSSLSYAAVAPPVVPWPSWLPEESDPASVTVSSRSSKRGSWRDQYRLPLHHTRLPPVSSPEIAMAQSARMPAVKAPLSSRAHAQLRQARLLAGSFVPAQPAPVTEAQVAAAANFGGRMY
jgi:hypothetical protein